MDLQQTEKCRQEAYFHTDIKFVLQKMSTHFFTLFYIYVCHWGQSAIVFSTSHIWLLCHNLTVFSSTFPSAFLPSMSSCYLYFLSLSLSPGNDHSFLRTSISLKSDGLIQDPGFHTTVRGSGSCWIPNLVQMLFTHFLIQVIHKWRRFLFGNDFLIYQYKGFFNRFCFFVWQWYHF